jgi:glyoxylase-like metal-dependent hydrolase (beta-lactamase superfamily II)
MIVLRIIPALLFLLAVAVPAEAAQPPANSGPPRTYHVAGPIHVAVQEDRNSMVVVGNDGLLIIESNYVERAQNLKSLVATISPLPVRIVINSHWHADHVGGNALFASEGAITIAHENTRRRMSVDQINRATGNVQARAWAPEFLPMITIREGMTLQFGGEEVVLVHTPDAHTDSDLFAHFPRSNVIFTGGLLNYPTYAGIRSADRFVRPSARARQRSDQDRSVARPAARQARGAGMARSAQHREESRRGDGARGPHHRSDHRGAAQSRIRSQMESQ